MSISSSKTTSKLGLYPCPLSSYMQARLRFQGQSFCLRVRLQFILQLIVQQPRWLIRSKQRAFNPIHVGFFSLQHEQPVKHNQMPHAKQRGGRRRPHLLSGAASRKLGSSQSENSWLHRWRSWEDLGESHSLAPAQRWEGALWGLQAEKHFLG